MPIAMGDVRIVGKKRGSTFGPDGSIIRFFEGQEQVLSEKAIEHVPDRFYETRPLSPKQKPTDRPSRSYDTSGSWKTLYKGGDEVGKVQCSTEEAEAWVAGDKPLDEIT